jgi:flavin reductase (DIM6/NTAB) family NADH-FMN oxidoreductase RutF
MSKPATVDDRAFRRACGQFATGVTIATVVDQAGNPHGLTVNSFTSVSLKPPLILICIDHRSSVVEPFRAASSFALNILTEQQRWLSDRFAQRLVERFDGIAWKAGVTGAPVFDGSLALIECLLRQSIDVGDHAVIIGEMVHAELGHGTPLIYYGSNYRTLEPQF